MFYKSENELMSFHTHSCVSGF